MRRMRLTRPPYGRRVRRALAFALAVHVLFFLFSPPFSIEPRPAASAAPDTMRIVMPDDIVPMDPPPDEPTPPGDPEPYREAVPTDDPIPPPPEPPSYPTHEPMRGVADGPDVRPPWRVYDAPPEMVFSVEPAYPVLARDAGIEGTVVVRVLVGEDGMVADAVVINSDGTEGMERAALEAAKRCRFRPARQQQYAVPAYVVIPYEFRLKR